MTLGTKAPGTEEPQHSGWLRWGGDGGGGRSGWPDLFDVARGGSDARQYMRPGG